MRQRRLPETLTGWDRLAGAAVVVRLNDARTVWCPAASLPTRTWATPLVTFAVRDSPATRTVTVPPLTLPAEDSR